MSEGLILFVVISLYFFSFGGVYVVVLMFLA
jgi:hypothetical protein